mmetsp:Transcript_16616/g.53016  ORF Transcript_16616/g.53016 Transcript_16616/m.53016 type:complete len:205 (+) Transcript_16616:85-699(+)
MIMRGWPSLHCWPRTISGSRRSTRDHCFGPCSAPCPTSTWSPPGEVMCSSSTSSRCMCWSCSSAAATRTGSTWHTAPSTRWARCCPCRSPSWASSLSTPQSTWLHWACSACCSCTRSPTTSASWSRRSSSARCCASCCWASQALPRWVSSRRWPPGIWRRGLVASTRCWIPPTPRTTSPSSRPCLSTSPPRGLPSSSTCMSWHS